MASYDLFANVPGPGLSQKYRELGLSQQGWAFHREALPLTGMLGLSQGVGPLTGRLGISQRVLASNR